jgi:DNA repair protein RadC
MTEVPTPATSPALRLRDLASPERPRERLARLGAAALSGEELLALLLSTGSRGESALDCARRLIFRHGGLTGLAALSPGELCRERGVKSARGARIAAALEIGRRLAEEPLAARDLLNEPGLVMEYLRRARGDGNQERTGALYLNARNRLLRDDPEVYRGTLDRAVVEPRELLKRALLANAAGLVVYHNHPSGDPTPSREDRDFTRRLSAAAEAVGVRLLDHIVVGREGCVSMREAGYL